MVSYFWHLASNTYDHLTHTLALSPPIKSRYRAWKAMKKVPMRSLLRQDNASAAALDNECPSPRGHLYGSVRKWAHAETRGRLGGDLDVHRPGVFLNTNRVHPGPRVPSPVPSTGKNFAHRTSQHAKREQDICRISRRVETFIST